MAGPGVHEFTDSNFQAEVIASESPVLVDFWAPWCSPCVRLGPTIDELAVEFAGKIKIGKVNVDNNQEYATKYGIQSIPALLFFKGGQVVAQVRGLAPKRELVSQIQKVIGEAQA